MAPKSVVLLVALAVVTLSGSLVGTIAPVAAVGGHAVPRAWAPPSAVVVEKGHPAPVPPVPSSAFVGPSPNGILIDPTNNTAYVTSEAGNNVTVLSLATGKPVATIPVGAQPYAGAMAIDPVNWTLYVANAGSGNVSVISIGSDSVIASVHVGSSPDAIAFDPANLELYVANGASGTVSVISPVTGLPHVVATIPVGAGPDAIAVDTAAHNVFVAAGGAHNVTVLDTTTNTVLNQTAVGSDPGTYGTIAFDAKSKDVYVLNTASNNLTVLGGKNRTAFATVAVGDGPDALAVDSTTHELFVANRFSDNVTVVSTVNRTILGSIPVGSLPGTQGGMALDAVRGLLYVPNAGSNNVSVISIPRLKVVASIDVGTLPTAAAVDPANGVTFAVNNGGTNVSLFDLAPTTFVAGGLPKGASWTISAAGSPAKYTSTIGKGRSAVTLVLPLGDRAFNATASNGYVVSRVKGPGLPTVDSVNVTDLGATFHLVFAPIETLTFTETGLPAHSVWSVLVHPASPGGPPSKTNSTNGTSLTFRLVSGGWRFQVTSAPVTYVANHASGSVHVAPRPTTKSLKFKQVTAVVLFEEAGLPNGTFWRVNVTGPESVNVSSTTNTIKVSLGAGTYTFEIWNYTLSYHPSPEHGTLVISAPHAPYVVAVSYSNTG